MFIFGKADKIMLYFALILYIVKLYAALPFILDELHSCNYNSSNDETSFTSKLFRVEYNNVIIYYTLCDTLPNNICGKNVAACMKNKQHNATEILGKKFTLGNDVKLSLETADGRSCKSDPSRLYKLTIKFDCFQEMKETHLEISDDCEYVITMMHSNCEPKCTTRVNNQLIDLRPLKGNYFIQSPRRNFSITLCGSNQICSNSNKGVSICEVTNNTTIPLSSFENEVMIFDKENYLKIRGSYKRPKSRDKKRVELVIKCSWDHNSIKIVDKTVPDARKNYKFEMESSFGCIKLPPDCVINKEFLIYNLTNLYNRDGYWQVSNVPNGSIYLNICGPLRVPKNNSNKCSSSFSQVCEVKDNIFLNKGSIISKFDVEDNSIKATFINGATSLDPNCTFGQHNTHIELICSKTAESPKFVRFEICDTFIHWNTPLVCPFYNKSSCTYIYQEFQNCSIQFQDRHYDLTPLTLNSGYYDIQDENSSSITYGLNVCGPVIVSDAPCMKHSMVLMNDLDQCNIKDRFKSLGKMDTMFIVNGNIVIKTSSGSYCGEEGDYTSIIIFICSDIEVKPRLINRTECMFHFEWRTPHACPNMHHSSEQKCIFQNAAKNISLNFAEMRQTSLRIMLNKIYEFDLCKENYKECLKDNCTYFPVQKTLLASNGESFVELNLPKKCKSKTDINKVVFQLICDNITYNEHFGNIIVENCSVKVDLSTSLVCPGQHVIIHEEIEKDKDNILKEQILEKEMENCSVSNHLTGYKFDISNLQLKIPVLRCPVVSFFNENSSVMLTYSSNNICQESKHGSTYDYRVLLKCSKDELKDLRKTKCSEVHKFEKPEFCKLFETSILDGASSDKSSTFSTGKIIGSVIGVLGIFGTSTLCCLLYRKHRRNPYNFIYEKDGDL